jgi:hypothetical protein
LLTPVDIPSETVILNDRLTKASSQAGPPPTGEAPDWLRQIKNMMLVLTGESTRPAMSRSRSANPWGCGRRRVF